MPLISNSGDENFFLLLGGEKGAAMVYSTKDLLQVVERLLPILDLRFIKSVLSK
ncbi:MAG: hypothetical protein KJ666_09720 [Bacteroidetes bacterium]|nr:hypothetical protein [Bacteroidota bacterium]